MRKEERKILDQRDLDILTKTMEDVVSKSEISILNKVDERLSRFEESILDKVDERLSKSEVSILDNVDERLLKSENLLLDELERTKNILDSRIDKVQKNIDDLNQYYKITKLETDNTALILKMIEGLSKRVEELEKRTA